MSLTPIVVMGAGGYARETRFLIDTINRQTPRYEFLGYVVSDLSSLTERDSRDEVLGDESWFAGHPTPLAVALGIGTPHWRRVVGERLKATYSHLHFPVLIAPDAVYDKNSCVFEEGVAISHGCLLTVNITLKAFSFLNLGVTVGHEAVVGRGSAAFPNVSISGGVTLGDEVLLGAGSQVLQYLRVGNRSTVGAQALVTQDVPDDTTVVGVPAKPLVKR